jgi:hypothetical protein
VLDQIVSANAEHKSAAKTQRMLRKLADLSVSVPLIMEVTGMVGQELHEALQQQAEAHAQGALPPQYAEAPGAVSVSVDGGRIMTRAVAGRGVHEPAWKETKNACLLTLRSAASPEDPHPHLPACFAHREYVEKLVREIHGAATGPAPEGPQSLLLARGGSEAQAWSGLAPPTEESLPAPSPNSDWRPKRLVRTCLSSLACSDDFGPVVAGEAQRRGFYQASRRAFLGDGQAWNWTLQERYFPDFVAITDFVHPLGYVYEAAQVLNPADPWPVYLRAAEACWQGRVGDFLADLRSWQAARPAPDGSLPEADPRAVVQRAVTYLENNRGRMKYPDYRRAGLPVSTAMVESLIKEINYRVKGTEKFWNRPSGAEQILQVRAAALGDDDRLSEWILNRPGSYYYRKSTGKPTLASAA